MTRCCGRRRGARSKRDTTLTAVVEQALRSYLGGSGRRRPAFRLDLLIKKGRPVQGVNLDDRDALHDLMDGRGR
jgi:hypothetical protein